MLKLREGKGLKGICCSEVFEVGLACFACRVL